MKASAMKWLLGGGALIALIVFGGFTYYRNSHKTDYLTARIERGDVESAISATGSSNAVVTVQVGSQVSGNIQALHADFNTKVKKGQVVAEIDPALFQAKVDQVRANLDSAKSAVVNARAMLKKSDADIANAVANVANQNANLVRAQSAVTDAKTKLDRRINMVKDKIISQEDLDTAKATYDQAVASLEATRAQLQAAQSSVESVRAQREVGQTQLTSAEAQVKQNQAQLQQAELDLQHTRIVAPVDGTVVARNMDVGQTVAASFAAPTIFLIAQDLTKMQVDTNVDESDVGRVRVGQQANFTVDAYPGLVFPGVVTQIRQAPINVQNVITYDVVVQVSNPDLKLFPGMTASVKILTDKQSGVPKIPVAALRFRPPNAPPPARTGKGGDRGKGLPQMQTIYTVDDKGQPKPLRVKLGISDGNFVSVAGGDVTEGERVIVGIASKNAPASAPGQQPGRGRGPGF